MIGKLSLFVYIWICSIGSGVTFSFFFLIICMYMCLPTGRGVKEYLWLAVF